MRRSVETRAVSPFSCAASLLPDVGCPNSLPLADVDAVSGLSESGIGALATGFSRQLPLRRRSPDRNFLLRFRGRFLGHATSGTTSAGLSNSSRAPGPAAAGFRVPSVKNACPVLPTSLKIYRSFRFTVDHVPVVKLHRERTRPTVACTR